MVSQFFDLPVSLLDWNLKSPYRKAIEAAFDGKTAKLHFPFAGLQIGKAMRAAKQAIAADDPQIEHPGNSGLINTREAVLQAIGECDDLGRAQFLRKYGFRQAKGYFLVHKGKRYDSKAIVAAAFGFEHPKHGPLKASEFSGGAATVQKWLDRLGFNVENAGLPFVRQRTHLYDETLPNPRKNPPSGLAGVHLVAGQVPAQQSLLQDPADHQHKRHCHHRGKCPG